MARAVAVQAALRSSGSLVAAVRIAGQFRGLFAVGVVGSQLGREQLMQNFGLCRLRRTHEAGGKQPADVAINVGRTFGQHAPTESLGIFHEHWVVQRGERLQRRVRAIALGGRSWSLPARRT